MRRAGATPEADIREKGGEPAAPEEGSSDTRLDVFKDFIQRLDKDDKPPDSKPTS